MKNKIYVPSKGVDSWRELLKSKKQWKDGFSAMAIAECWENQKNGFPREFRKPLQNLGLKLNVLLAIPEYKVPLNTGKAPSQNDLFILCKDINSSELVVVMIEGKVDESFDKTVEEWNSEESITKKERLEFLIKELEIKPNVPDYDTLRYQLFHRTASAILTAKQFNINNAMMIVHSFSLKNKWHKDYSNFAKTLNQDLSAEVGTIEKCTTLNSGIELYIGWIKGDCKYLEM